MPTPQGYVSIYVDPNTLIHRLGNLTAGGTGEVLVCSRGYTEQASEAQRSVVSTSANDANPSGSGAKAVRITYLDSNYVVHTEDINLNGTTAVNTVGTDIRFVERFEVIKGAACAGAVKIMTTTGGGGSEFCGMSAGTLDAFLCHHYVPAGMRAFLMGWGAITNLDANFKLYSQQYFNGNLVDQIIDLDNLTGLGIITPGRLSMERRLQAPLPLGEKTRVRVHVVPGVSGLVTRAFFDLTEVPL